MLYPPHPAFVFEAQNFTLTSAAFYCDWHNHVIWNFKGLGEKEKDVGMPKPLWNGGTIDTKEINHEINFLNNCRLIVQLLC